MTNILIRFLGLHDKKQQQKSEEVSNYVHDKKNKFTSDMVKVQHQAKKVHERTLQAQQESSELIKVVEDITSQIAKATPGGRNYGR